jgi:hypothetical protein
MVGHRILGRKQATIRQALIFKISLLSSMLLEVVVNLRCDLTEMPMTAAWQDPPWSNRGRSRVQGLEV